MTDSVSGLATLRDYWPRRFTLVGLCFCSTFICYIDRVNISVAILPMAQEYGWTQTTQGVVLSSCAVCWGWALLPCPALR